MTCDSRLDNEVARDFKKRCTRLARFIRSGMVCLLGKVSSQLRTLISLLVKLTTDISTPCETVQGSFRRRMLYNEQRDTRQKAGKGSWNAGTDTQWLLGKRQTVALCLSHPLVRAATQGAPSKKQGSAARAISAAGKVNPHTIESIQSNCWQSCASQQCDYLAVS